MSVFEPLAVGILFGMLLNRAGLTRYERIVGVYRFTDLTVLKFLLTAIVVGAAAIQAALSLGLVASVPTPGLHLGADLVGGALFGVGMATAGFCPGTIIAGAGRGQLDYLVGGGCGLLTGALVYGWSYSAFMPRLLRVGAGGAVTVAGILGASPWLVVILLAELALLGFYAIERGARQDRAGAPAGSRASQHLPRPAH